MGNEHSRGQMGQRNVRYHNGVRVVEEDHYATNLQRERFREQRERLRKIEEHGATQETPQEIRIHYSNREIYEDFVEAVAEVVRRHAPEQEPDVVVMVRNHRGIEKRLYKALHQLYGMEPNWEPVAFDLNDLPFKGDAATYRRKMNEMAAWMSRASDTVVRAQAKIRGFITLRRAMRDKANGEGVYAPRPKTVPTEKTPKSGVETKTDPHVTSASPKVSDVTNQDGLEAAVAAKPMARQKTRKSRRAKRSKSRRKSKEPAPAPADLNPALIMVSNKIRSALADSQISAELLFFMHDDKNTGRIDQKHWLQLCRQDLHIGAKDLTDKQISDVFIAIDSSHDGELQQEELEAFLELNFKASQEI